MALAPVAGNAGREMIATVVVLDEAGTVTHGDGGARAAHARAAGTSNSEVSLRLFFEPDESPDVTTRIEASGTLQCTVIAGTGVSSRAHHSHDISQDLYACVYLESWRPLAARRARGRWHAGMKHVSRDCTGATGTHASCGDAPTWGAARMGEMSLCLRGRVGQHGVALLVEVRQCRRWRDVCADVPISIFHLCAQVWDEDSGSTELVGVGCALLDAVVRAPCVPTPVTVELCDRGGSEPRGRLSLQLRYVPDSARVVARAAAAGAGGSNPTQPATPGGAGLVSSVPGARFVVGSARGAVALSRGRVCVVGAVLAGAVGLSVDELAARARTRPLPPLPPTDDPVPSGRMLVSGVLRSTDEAAPLSPRHGGSLLSPDGGSPRDAGAWDAVAQAAAVAVSTPPALFTLSGGLSPSAAGGAPKVSTLVPYTPEGARLDALRDDVESLDAALRSEADAALRDGMATAWTEV